MKKGSSFVEVSEAGGRMDNSQFCPWTMVGTAMVWMPWILSHPLPLQEMHSLLLCLHSVFTQAVLTYMILAVKSFLFFMDSLMYFIWLMWSNELIPVSWREWATVRVVQCVLWVTASVTLVLVVSKCWTMNIYDLDNWRLHLASWEPYVLARWQHALGWAGMIGWWRNQ